MVIFKYFKMSFSIAGTLFHPGTKSSNGHSDTNFIFGCHDAKATHSGKVLVSNEEITYHFFLDKIRNAHISFIQERI